MRKTTSRCCARRGWRALEGRWRPSRKRGYGGSTRPVSRGGQTSPIPPPLPTYTGMVRHWRPISPRPARCICTSWGFPPPLRPVWMKTMSDSIVLLHCPHPWPAREPKRRGRIRHRAAVYDQSHDIAKEIEMIRHLAVSFGPRVSDIYGELRTLGRLGNAKIDPRPASAAAPPAPPPPG